MPRLDAPREDAAQREAEVAGRDKAERTRGGPVRAGGGQGAAERDGEEAGGAARRGRVRRQEGGGEEQCRHRLKGAEGVGEFDRRADDYDGELEKSAVLPAGPSLVRAHQNWASSSRAYQHARDDLQERMREVAAAKLELGARDDKQREAADGACAGCYASEDYAEGVASFLGKRRAGFLGK